MMEGQPTPDELLVEPKSDPASLIKLWKIFLVLFGLIVFLFISSAIICGTDAKCVNYIPTVKNMLNSTFATPFIVSGLDAALGVHFITSTFLYFSTSIRAPYWSLLQILSAVLTYATCIITLFVLPFSGWANNWANVATLVMLVLWMAFAQISLKRNRHSIGLLLGCMMLYIVCVIIYIVVRAVPDIPLAGRDIGILVVEIMGGLALVVFVCICISHIYRMSIKIITYESINNE